MHNIYPKFKISFVSLLSSTSLQIILRFHTLWRTIPWCDRQRLSATSGDLAHLGLIRDCLPHQMIWHLPEVSSAWKHSTVVFKLWRFWVPSRYKQKRKWMVEIFMINDFVVSELFILSLRYLRRLCESVFYHRARPKHVFQLEDHG